MTKNNRSEHVDSEAAYADLLAQLEEIAPELSDEERRARIAAFLQAAQQPRSPSDHVIVLTVKDVRPPTESPIPPALLIQEWVKDHRDEILARLRLDLPELAELAACTSECHCVFCRLARDGANGIVHTDLPAEGDPACLAICDCATCRLLREALLRTGGRCWGPDAPIADGAVLLASLGLKVVAN